MICFNGKVYKNVTHVVDKYLKPDEFIFRIPVSEIEALLSYERNGKITDFMNQIEIWMTMLAI